MLLLTLILSAILCGCAVKAESFDVNFEKTKIEANCLVNDDEISEDKKQAEFDF